MVMSPSLMVGLVLSLPIISSLDFSWPKWILYLLVVLFVIDGLLVFYVVGDDCDVINPQKAC